jgi:DMSO/TMAO reductase YedYZ molybdopterin-dependent catalytic subunit
MDPLSYLDEHRELTRRFFLQAGLSGAVVSQYVHASAPQEPKQDPNNQSPVKRSKPDKAGIRRDPYFTPADDFRDVSRGNPLPHSLSDDKKKEVGLTRDTWRLQVLADPENPARISKPLSNETGNPFTFDDLLKMASKSTIRIPKVMTCLNLGCPLGMGLWEGIPLRDVIWLTQPRENLRRVFYYGYHNEDPKQVFRSSLPIGRILEDPAELPPVILCHKLNGEFLDSERGGPVRMLVPEAYGFKSVKWLTHLFLTNLAHANDTYAEQNNDIDSPLKTFAATILAPREAESGKPIPVTGYAQVGVSGLSRVQVSVTSASDAPTKDDPYFTQATWFDAQILPAPERWSGLIDGRIPPNTYGFTEEGLPKSWPMKLANAHWAAILPAMPSGNYVLRCRTIDQQGVAQPMPRPFRKSGHASIESIDFKVVD